MKYFLGLIIIAFVFTSCDKKQNDNSFEVIGDLKNAPDQEVYLDQLFFSDKSPEVIDTAKIVNGKFVSKGSSLEEGMFRLRLEKSKAGFIFINDAKEINFSADINDSTLSGPSFQTKGNLLLKNFLLYMDSQRAEMLDGTSKLEALKSSPQNDSLVTIASDRLEKLDVDFKNYLIRYIDTVSDPVVAMFAVGYTRGIPMKELNQAVPGLVKRFPNHSGVAAIVKQYESYLAKENEPKKEANSKPSIGDMAPEITMNDENGKSFSLSELRGKYVLVDFWASWCAPCRAENPNVVAAFQKYKGKNFTVLGVSLDKDKNEWLKAIKADNLQWKQISDLKYWNSASVELYGFDGIPYNVLIDPTGKIIATELREQALDKKLAEVLK